MWNPASPEIHDWMRSSMASCIASTEIPIGKSGASG